VLAHVAEVDARRLYLPAGYPSMYAYCVGELRLSEEAAFKRIRSGRAARRYPAIFDAIADGRLHLSAVVLLAPHLTPQNVDELLAAAAGRTRADIELLLARRFPRPFLPCRLEPVQGSDVIPGGLLLSSGTAGSGATQLSPGTVGTLAGVCGHELAPVGAGIPPARLTPLAPRRFGLQATLSQATYEKLRRAQELLRHQVPAGDIAQVLDRALDVLIAKLERRKFAAAARPRGGDGRAAAGPDSRNPRAIPARVKRAVWARDGGCCTFVGTNGHRCESRTRLEFDHVEEVARGGRATVAGIRLRGRAHNQYTVECTFGAAFMENRRERARRRREAHAAPATGGASGAATGPENTSPSAPAEKSCKHTAAGSPRSGRRVHGSGRARETRRSRRDPVATPARVWTGRGAAGGGLPRRPALRHSRRPCASRPVVPAATPPRPRGFSPRRLMAM
jgi:hypothetical protein